MDVVIALDFDGTLYPITDYDSEQLLLHLSGREGAEELIERDKKGGFDPVSFNADFERIIHGLEVFYIDEAARIIHGRCADEDFSSLRRLQAKGCHIAIISCGSDLLISRFLALAGLEAEMIVAKEIVVEDGRISKVKSHINDIREKEEAIRRIRERAVNLFPHGSFGIFVELYKIGDHRSAPICHSKILNIWPLKQ